MGNFSKIIYIFFISSILFLSACSTTRHLEEGERLLVKNSLEVNEIDTIADDRNLQSQILDLAVQEPNTKFLIFPFRLWLYNAFYDTTKGINRLLRDRLGDAPVIFDSIQAARSTDIMQRFLFNKGYFNADVSYETDSAGDQKVEVTYIVNKRGLDYIQDVHYEIDNDRMLRLVYIDDPVIEKGSPYDVDQLLAERQRITKNFQNYGYFNFNRQYVYYEVDTLNAADSVDIFIYIEPPADDTMHHVYYINNIYIYPDYNRLDTIPYGAEDTVNINEFYIIAKNLKYKPKALLQSVFFAKDDLYKLDDHQLTINRLTDLGVFRFVNIRFREFEENGIKKLDVIIELLPSPKQNFTFDLEAYYATLAGIQTGVSYANKNLFRYADLFTLNVSGGIENDFSTQEINIFDFSSEANIYFPKFMVPFDIGKINRSFNPKTRISGSYKYFKRVEYFTMQNIALSYGFDWKEFAPKRHVLTIPLLNYVQITDTTALFNEKLNSSPFLRKSFENQFILGASYSFIYNNQELTDSDRARFFRFNIETSGNLLTGINTLIGGNRIDGDYALLGQRYAQYVRPDGELRLYRYLSPGATLAGRLFAGVGFAYGNSDEMPYIKKYVIGGANSIRAFRIRSLGPGRFIDTVNLNQGRFFIDQVGDMKLEGNIEYRFDITTIFEGAVFLDAGNVWNLKENTNTTSQTETAFEFNDFWTELAVGTGFGARLDFSFFIIRFDLGIPIIDPGLRPVRNSDGNLIYDGSTFILDKAFDRDFKRNIYNERFGRTFFNLNLAIGYPF